MVDMSNSHARDSLSLLEGYRIQGTGKSHSGASRPGQLGVTDETILMLDRLKEVTQKAVQLEVSIVYCVVMKYSYASRRD